MVEGSRVRMKNISFELTIGHLSSDHGGLAVRWKSAQISLNQFLRSLMPDDKVHYLDEINNRSYDAKPSQQRHTKGYEEADIRLQGIKTGIYGLLII